MFEFKTNNIGAKSPKSLNDLSASVEFGERNLTSDSGLIQSSTLHPNHIESRFKASTAISF